MSLSQILSPTTGDSYNLFAESLTLPGGPVTNFPLSAPFGAQITANFPVPSVNTTWLTSLPVAVGTWLFNVTVSYNILSNATTPILNLFTVAGTAAATFSGVSQLSLDLLTPNGQDIVSYSFIARVTTTGTIVFSANTNDSSSVYILSAADSESGSGYTAIRVA